MTGSPTGRPTTPEDRLWAAFGATFTPDKQISMLDDKAEGMVARTAVIGAVLTAGGLVAVTTILTNPVARVWAIIAISLSVAAILASLVTQVRWPNAFHPGNIIELRKWFDRYTTWRGWLLAAASFLLVAGFVAGVVSAAVALTTDVREPTIGLTRVDVPQQKDQPATVTATGTAVLPAAGPSETAVLILTADGDEVASAVQGVGADSKITVNVEAAGISPDAKLILTVTGARWMCTIDTSRGGTPDSSCTENGSTP